jgi:hypothetical protein
MGELRLTQIDSHICRLRVCPIQSALHMRGCSLGNLPENPGEEKKRKREGPREKKKNGPFPFTFSLFSGPISPETIPRSLPTCVSPGPVPRLKKRKEKEKEKPRKSRAAEIAEDPKSMQGRAFSWFLPFPFHFFPLLRPYFPGDNSPFPPDLCFSRSGARKRKAEKIKSR